VVCVDKDASKIVRLQRYEIPIYDPGLEDIVRENAGAGRLAFTTDLAAAVRDVDLAFIAVGTDAKVQRLVECAKHDIQVASNPEFLKEVGAISDFMYPDRIVIGVRPGHERARRLLDRIYHPLNLSSTKIVWMNRERVFMGKATVGVQPEAPADLDRRIRALRWGVGVSTAAIPIGAAFFFGGAAACLANDVGNLFVSNQGCSTGQRAVGGIGIALMILGTAGMITSAVLLRRRKQERKRLHASRRLHWNHASGSFVF
jgi:hypothetical protein